MLNTPEALEAAANRFIGEEPIVLEQGTGVVVSLDSAARLLDQRTYQNFRDTGETGLEFVETRVDIEVTGSRSMLWRLVDLVQGRLSSREWDTVTLKLGIRGGRERSFAQVGMELGIPKSTAFDVFYRGIGKLTSNP